MKCPDCNNELEDTHFVIDTLPQEYHYYCNSCNALWDVSWDEDEVRIRECFQSPRKQKGKEGLK